MGPFFKAGLPPTLQWLKCNLIFRFVHFYMTVHFKSLENRISVDPDKISRKLFMDKLFGRLLWGFLLAYRIKLNQL
jgi:hypothetical protein